MNSYKELDKKDRVDFYIALAVILCVLSFVLFYSLSHLFSDKEATFLQSDKEEILLDDTLYVDGATYVPLILDQDHERKISNADEAEKVMAIVDTNAISTTSIESENSSSRDSSITEIYSKDITLDSSAEVDTTLAEISNLEYEITSETLKKEEDIEEIIDTIATEESENEVVTQQPSKEIDKSCVIAVGIYRSERNAQKMLNRLEAAGFDAFSTSRRNKYRVQVYHPCDKDSLYNSLNDIRTNFASDALILVKE